jgi:hypothetical protein
MLIVDAVVELVRADAEWARYCEIAPRVWPAADATRELLRARLSSYDFTGRWISGGFEAEDSFRLEQMFLERFVAAVHDGRYSVRGVPHGGAAVVDIDPMLITVETLKRIKGDQWELAGATWHAVRVIASASPGPEPGKASPELRPASLADIHAAIAAEYADCEKAGRKPPNVKEIGKPAQDRLRAQALYASANHIQTLAADKQYAALRLKPGQKSPPS